MIGLWWWFLARRLELPGEFKPGRNLRILSTTILGVTWLLAVCLIASGWMLATYFSLILAWALPAIILQLSFGADILWHYRKLVVLTILPVFFYISETRFAGHFFRHMDDRPVAVIGNIHRDAADRGSCFLSDHDDAHFLWPDVIPRARQPGEVDYPSETIAWSCFWILPSDRGKSLNRRDRPAGEKGRL